MSLAIPPIPPSLEEPIRALVRCSILLEKIVVAMAEGKSFQEIASTQDRLDALEGANRAIAAWCDHLGIDRDTLDDKPQNGKRPGAKG